MMFLAGEPAFGYPPVTYVWFLLLAIIPQLLGHSSFNWALKYVFRGLCIYHPFGRADRGDHPGVLFAG